MRRGMSNGRKKNENAPKFATIEAFCVCHSANEGGRAGLLRSEL